MSAIDSLLLLLSRFEPKGPSYPGKPPKTKRHAKESPKAHRYRVRHSLGGSLSPTRCGASQSQTWSMRMDVETTTDIAAAIGYGQLNSHSTDPNVPVILQWLARVMQMDQGKSREGAFSLRYAFEDRSAIKDDGRVSVPELKQVIAKLPALKERIPAPPESLVWTIASEAKAEAIYHRLPLDDGESERLARTALYALVDTEPCRRCGGTGVEPKKRAAVEAWLARKGPKVCGCGQCCGVGWLAFPQREIAQQLRVSQRDHKKRTQIIFRTIFARLVQQMQDVASEAQRARL